jgi:hypothetical protein
MRFWLNLFFLALTGAFHAQTLTFDKVKHDFGNLESYDLRYVDFKLKNTGAKKEWILSVKKPQELIYLSSKQFIDKDSTGILRFQVNPKTKGKFAYDVEVYTSDRAEPVKLKIIGNLLELDLNEGNTLTDCPDFNARPGGVDPNQFKLKVITVDESTREVLSNSSVSLIQNGRESWTKRTDKDGEIREEGTIGFSYFYATHEGYFPAELGAYINHNRNTIVLKLKKGELVLPPVDTTTVVYVPETPTPELIGELPPSFTDLDRDNFDPKYFKPVNVVFVLDISSSMKQADKMELMKYSLAQLTSMLRPEDKITLVTYSSDAQVYMRALSGADKDKIYEKVFEDGGNVHDINTKGLFGIDEKNPSWKTCRAAAKIFFFGGIAYGGGEREIYQKILMEVPDIDLSFEGYVDARRRWFKEHKEYALWHDEVQRIALEERTSLIFSGWKRELLGAKNDILKHSLNTPIQGGAGHIINQAMIRINKRLNDEKLKTLLIGQIHDQLILDSPFNECQRAGQILVEEMEREVEINGKKRTFKVDLEGGFSLGSLKKFDEILKEVKKI